MRALSRVAVIALSALSLMGGAAHAAERAPKPTITLSSNALKPGTSVTIIGQHWPQGATFQASLCGNRAYDGSANCVADTAVTMTPGPDGSFTEPMQVIMPPVPCPCVVLVTRLDSGATRTIPVQVVGAPFAPVQLHVPPRLTKSIDAEATVDSSTTLASLFGGAGDRTLVVKLHNRANVTLHRVLVITFWGKDQPDHPIPTRLVTLPAHRTVTVRLPFQLDPLSIGGYEVKGAAGTGGNNVEFSATTSQWPWLLMVLVLIVIVLVIVFIVRAVRRRQRRREAELEAGAGGAAGAEGVEVAAETNEDAAEGDRHPDAEPEPAGAPAPLSWSYDSPDD